MFGCCAAYELARSGARVAVIERDPIDVHASSRNPGNLNPILGAPSALVPFAIESLRLHLELSGTLAADGGARYALEPVRRVLVAFDDNDERPWRTVVGVVTDTEKEFASNPPPDLYVPYAQNPRSYHALVVRTDRPEPTMFEPVKRAVSTVDPALALSGVESMADVIADQGGQRRGLTALLGGFAFFALGLTVLALYASLSYTVVQRRAELAVRMALGARGRSILRLVAVEGLVTAALGVVPGR